MQSTGEKDFEGQRGKARQDLAQLINAEEGKDAEAVL